MPTRASTKRTPNTVPAAELRLAVQYALAEADATTAALTVPTRTQVRRWVKAALSVSADITVRFVEVAEGTSLNHDYRGKNGPTNVLSFIYAQGPPISGDIAVCAPVVEQEAAEQSKSLMAHYAHLIVHGVLHLQGWDHQTDVEANAMETREAEIVMALGYPHPYLNPALN